MNEHEREIMFSSNKDDWETPDDLYVNLDKHFGFTLDPASSVENAKCKKYFTKENDGLYQSWENETVFLNPPYGRNIVIKWVDKAYEESLWDDKDKVLLIAARTDTKYIADYVSRVAEMYFIKGRLRFSNAKDVAPFPSVILVFNGKRNGNREIHWTNKDFTEFW